MAFDKTLLISVKNVDLPTGLNVLNSISKRFNVKSILIYGSPRDLTNGEPGKEGEI